MQIPQFTGNPLSSILPIPKTEQDPVQLWLYARHWGKDNRELSLDSISELIADGWKMRNSETVGSSVLESQLYDTIVLYPAENPQQKPSMFYKVAAGEQEPSPVILSFSIPRWPDLQRLPMLNPFPLSQYGEFAYVINPGQGQSLTSYYIMQLPLEARQRWVALGEKLKELSSPLHWPPFAMEHKIASNDIEYQRRINSIRTQVEIAIGETKKQLFHQGTQLEAARIHITQLRSALQKETLVQQWQEVQIMARELAHDYYDHHQNVIQQYEEAKQILPAIPVDPSATLFPAEIIDKLATEQPTKSKRAKTQRPRREPTPIVAKGKETISHNSNQLNWEIINALRDKNSYTHYPDYNLAEHKHPIMKDQGQLIITISAQKGEGWETVLNALNTLGDGCIDTYIAVTAIAIEQNGTEGDRLRIPIIITPDDILSIRGMEKSHGSYTPFQRAEVIKHLKTLSQSKIIATMPGRPPATTKRGKKKDDGTILRAEGQLIDLLSFKIGEYHTITGEEIWEKHSISVGPWATMIPGLNITTAMMFRDLLAYSSKNQRYQKRIGLYLTQMFRVNAKFGGEFKEGITMARLLEGSGIVPEKKNPGRFRDAIFNAIDQLVADGIIGKYWQIVDASASGQQIAKEVQEQAYGWADKFLQQKWNFSPPERVLQQYKSLLREPKKPK